MAHCVISAIVDTDVDYALVPACIVHASRAPCMHDGEPANPAPLHAFNHQDREAAVRVWRLRTRGQRPLIIHDEKRVPDPEDHVIEDEILPCPCGAEVLEAREAAIGGDEP
jgi:hypothetical protein